MNHNIGDEVHEISHDNMVIRLAKYNISKILTGGNIEISNSTTTKVVSVYNNNIFFSCDEALKYRTTLIKNIKHQNTSFPTKIEKHTFSPNAYKTKRLTLVKNYPTIPKNNNSKFEYIGKSANTVIHSNYHTPTSKNIIGLLTNIKQRKGRIYSNYYPSYTPTREAYENKILPNIKGRVEIIKNSAGIVVGIKKIDE